MALIRLSPEQVSFYWERLRPLFLQNLIPKISITEETIFRVLQSFMTGAMQLWAGIEDGEGPVEERVYGFMATTIDTDSMTQERNLLLYSVFSVKEIPITAWASGFSIINAYKEQQKCKKLIAYTDVPEIIAIAKRMGFKQYTFLVKE